MVLSVLLIVVAGMATASDPTLVLQNGHIRVELEPRTFSLRYLGFPGGKNFLDPIYLSETEIAGAGWVAPGGVVTDLVPVSRAYASLRRGPATIAERTDDYILLLGPAHPESGWQFKKEYQLTRDSAALTYKLTVQTQQKEERSVRVRITAQLPEEGIVFIPHTAGELGFLRGAGPALRLLHAPEDSGYRIPLAANSSWRRAVLASPASELTYTTGFGVWSRRLEVRSAAPDEDSTYQFLALLDEASHTYQVALEAAQAGVNVGAPLVVVEHWTLSRPGGLDEQAPMVTATGPGATP